MNTAIVDIYQGGEEPVLKSRVRCTGNFYVLEMPKNTTASVEILQGGYDEPVLNSQAREMQLFPGGLSEKSSDNNCARAGR